MYVRATNRLKSDCSIESRPSVKAGPDWSVDFYGLTHSRLQNEHCIIPATLFSTEAAMYCTLALSMQGYFATSGVRASKQPS